MEPIVNKLAKCGRNDPCPCGSEIKMKRCCESPKRAAYKISSRELVRWLKINDKGEVAGERLDYDEIKDSDLADPDVWKLLTDRKNEILQPKPTEAVQPTNNSACAWPSSSTSTKLGTLGLMTMALGKW